MFFLSAGGNVSSHSLIMKQLAPNCLSHRGHRPWLIDGQCPSFCLYQAGSLVRLPRFSLRSAPPHWSLTGFLPGSEWRSHRIVRDYRVSGAERLELHHPYRVRAWLGENRESIKEHLSARNWGLFSLLSMVFFHTITLCFKGEARGKGVFPRPPCG